MTEIIANAKINLFLEIVGKRLDGYHIVDTVMQEVSVSDEISVRLLSASQGIIIKSNIDSIPTDERNIANIAARRFFDRIDENCGAEIIIRKIIPHEAGMGGGSSDGAAVLKALNELCGCPLDIMSLHEIASAMGADVPFFLYGGTAHMRGTGTQFVSSLLTPELDLVIAKPNVGISTPQAYRYLDKIHNDFEGHEPVDIASLINALAQDPRKVSECLFNRFETAADDLCPQTKLLRLFMSKHSHAALLSGSGAAVFAVVDGKKDADKLKDLIEQEFPGYYVSTAKTV